MPSAVLRIPEGRTYRPVRARRGQVCALSVPLAFQATQVDRRVLGARPWCDKLCPVSSP